MNMSEYVQFLSVMEKLPIKKGDILMVSSDITNLMCCAIKQDEKPDLNQFIDSLIAKVGPGGTLLFPTYNWGFCRGQLFDYNQTKSRTGALGEVARRRTDFLRTRHPIYSFAVWGKDKELLYNMTNISSFGADSPFAYLHKHKAKSLVIDVILSHCFTFVHYTEECAMSPYRYFKYFTAEYIDRDGISDHRTYSMFVRDLDLDVNTNLAPIEEDFKIQKVVSEYLINDISFKMVDLEGCFPIMYDDIKNNRARKICSYNGQNK